MLRTALSAILLLGAWATAGIAPASAADAPSTASASASTAKAPASAGLLSAMQKDLGLTASQAKARLSAEKTATAVQGKARRAAGPSYGGSWFDPATGKLTVAVTSDKKADAVRATGAAVRLVAHGARQLDAAKRSSTRFPRPTVSPAGTSTRRPTGSW